MGDHVHGGANAFQIGDLLLSIQVCRCADGYQPHLVSPEKGVKALSNEALNLVADHVKNCVQNVYVMLVNAAR